MSDSRAWEGKLDPFGRLQAEEGLPEGGVDVTIRLAGSDTAMARQVERAGLELYAQVGDILAGHVADSADLKNIAELACVREVQLSRPTYPDQP
jgi:hypothetical protein